MHMLVHKYVILLVSLTKGKVANVLLAVFCPPCSSTLFQPLPVLPVKVGQDVTLYCLY